MKPDSNNTADYILEADAVFDGTGRSPFPSFVAVSGDKIMAVSNCYKEKQRLTGPETVTLPFGGSLIIPGFCESHAHVFYGALELSSANLLAAESEQEAAAMIQDYEENPETGWIFAFGWNHHYWNKKETPARHSLDRLFPNRPVAAINEELHALWVNSMALELAGINRDTTIPEDMGVIEKDGDGNPTGFLLETVAMKPVLDKAFQMDTERVDALLSRYFRTVSRLGITSISNLQIHDILMPNALRSMEKKGNLTAKVFLVPSISTPMETLLKMKEDYNSSLLQFSGVKGFVDGTPMGYTGWLLDEYCDRPGFLGEIYLTADNFALKAAEFEKEEIRMRLHACGDGAVREALNIIEKARRSKTGPLFSGPRHTVEHIEVIHPDDILRFQELGAIASVQPDHMWSLVFEEHPFHKILGQKRCRYTYPFRTLADSGAALAFGSDHPIAELNPLRGIYRAVTRLAEDRKPEGGWNPNEKLTLAQALSAYTYGSAYQMGQEKITGSLEAGKAADITVLDKNLFRVDPEEILEARPVLTMMNGQIHHHCTP